MAVSRMCRCRRKGTDKAIQNTPFLERIGYVASTGSSSCGRRCFSSFGLLGIFCLCDYISFLSIRSITYVLI